MKIVFVIDNLYAGGKQRRLVTLIKGILVKYKKVDIHLILLKDQVDYKEIYTLPVKLHIFKRKHKKEFSLFARFYNLLRDIKPDIVHTWGVQPSVYTFLIAKILHIKFVNGLITNSHIKPFTGRWFWSRITFLFSDVILANSLAGLKNYNVPIRKGKVVYNGFDYNRLNNIKQKKEILRNFGIKSDFIVGMVGSLDNRKDYKTFINAAISLLNSGRNDMLFLIVGEGTLMEEFRNIVPQKYNNKIKFLGACSNIDELINIMDIGVLMTNNKYHLEGISNTIIEYMAHGVPVIASDSGGTKEIVRNNLNGYLIEPYSVDQLVHSILEIFNNNNLKEKFSINGKKTIKEMFSNDSMTEKFMNIYLELNRAVR